MHWGVCANRDQCARTTAGIIPRSPLRRHYRSRYVEYGTGEILDLVHSGIQSVSHESGTASRSASQPAGAGLLAVPVRLQTARLPMRSTLALWLVGFALLSGLTDRSNARQSQFRKKVWQRQHPSNQKSGPGLPAQRFLLPLPLASCFQIDYDKLEEEWMDDEEPDGGARHSGFALAAFKHEMPRRA